MLVATGISATLTVMPLLALAVIGERNAGAGYGRFRVFGSVGYLFEVDGRRVLACGDLPPLETLPDGRQKRCFLEPGA